MNPGSLDRADWVWKCFTRGLHPIFMDNPPIRGNDKHPALADWAPDGPSARTRAAMGQTLQYAQRMDLAAMTPRGDLSSTRYCLAASGKEYLVYQPDEGPFRVLLSGSRDTAFAVEWLDPKAGVVVDGKPVKTTQQTTFVPPFSGNSVLYLKVR